LRASHRPLSLTSFAESWLLVAHPNRPLKTPPNGAKVMTRAVLYTRGLCCWCQDAKRYLQQRGIAFDEVDVGRDRAAYEAMKRLSGQRYVPVFVMNGRVLANFAVEDLEKFLGELNSGATDSGAPSGRDQ
jgi:glutaredoxin